MANFSSNSITERGRLLLADVQAGAVFIATKIVIGSGNLPAGKTPATMTAVVSPVKELTINKKERTPDGKAIYGGVYSNADITEAFYFRELALYARAEYRDSSGAVTKSVPEVLYSYGNAGATADYMPAYSTSTVVEKQMDLVIWVGNNTQIDLTIASGIYITADTVEQYLTDYAKNDAVNQKISDMTENLIIPMLGDIKTLDERIGVLDGRVSDAQGKIDSANAEITALKANDTALNDALSEKAELSHSHSASDIVSGTLPVSRGGTGAATAADACANLGAAPLASPAFTGAPKAPAAATDYTTYRLRNVALVSSAPASAIGNGQLVGVYS